MSEKTAIEWTDASWNPWQGCHHVSPGCEHCYMFREKRAYGQDPDVVVRSKPPTFNLPFKLKAGSKVFTCSWSDFFIKEADQWREEAWRIIKQTPHLTYIILTKRIERALTRLPWGDGEPWPHVWLLVSVEDQATADRRVPLLLQTNAAVRGVSYEPALGPIDLERFCVDGAVPRSIPLDWLICGGESGPKARPMHPDWARSVRDQCQAAGVPFFFKQWGGWSPDQGKFKGKTLYQMMDKHYYIRPSGEIVMPSTDAPGEGGVSMYRVGKKAAGRLLDGREWSEFPNRVKMESAIPLSAS